MSAEHVVRDIKLFLGSFVFSDEALNFKGRSFQEADRVEAVALQEELLELPPAVHAPFCIPPRARGAHVQGLGRADCCLGKSAEGLFCCSSCVCGRVALNLVVSQGSFSLFVMTGV